MSWLTYGVDIDNSLVAIEDVPSGRTHLLCPYCGGELTAKKGQKKEYHFAHTDETCLTVAQRNSLTIPTLPLYDKFNIFLNCEQLEFLKKLWHHYGCNNKTITGKPPSVFLKEGLLKYNEFRRGRGFWGGYEFTKLGKIPIGALSLMLFNEVQEPILLEKLERLQDEVVDAIPELDLAFRLTDLRIYRAQMRKILLNSLYYLEVQADGQTFYKIGVTTRPIEQRVAEVQRDLQSHFQTISIQVLGTWTHRGNVEKYFKYRYADFNYPIGSLTEYYKFDDPDDALAIKRDLRRMKPKVLSEIELDILEGKPSQIEQVIEAEQKAQKRSQSICVGMQKAAASGVHIGRPTGVETDQAFLSKPSSLAVISALNQGLSLRQAATQAGVAVNTVRKVKAALRK